MTSLEEISSPRFDYDAPPEAVNSAQPPPNSNPLLQSSEDATLLATESGVRQIIVNEEREGIPSPLRTRIRLRSATTEVAGKNAGRELNQYNVELRQPSDNKEEQDSVANKKALGAHMQHPRFDGFGKVIATVALRGSAVTLLYGPYNEEKKDHEGVWKFVLKVGEAYSLSGLARTNCLHAVHAVGDEFRESLTLRFGHYSSDDELSEQRRIEDPFSTFKCD